MLTLCDSVKSTALVAGVYDSKEADMFFDNPFKTRMPNDDEYLVGRQMPIFNGGAHAVLFSFSPE